MVKKNSLILLLAALSEMCFAQKAYEIYPVPQSQVVSEKAVSFSHTVNIVCGDRIDSTTVARALGILSEKGLSPLCSKKPSKTASNVLLGVCGDKSPADRIVSYDPSFFTSEKYDKHILNLYSGKNGVANVAVLGENTDAVFCGLASLEQILDGGTRDLACVCIRDYADIKYRGIIEGYYGVPYSAEVTKDLFRYMARYKLNTYMYGAKSDPYHSRFWSEPYPTEITEAQKKIGYLSQDMLKDITDVAHATKVDFIWAIHPGTAFTDPQNADVNSRIMDKFEDMYELGVRQFGVFVDDVGVPSDKDLLKLGADRLTELQNLIDARWNSDGVLPSQMVKPLHYVPQLYAFSWVSRDKARTFFESLSLTPEKVNIYITGRNVWSVPNNEDLAIVKNFLGRPVSWWWNYPCNDNDMTKLFPADMYTNFRDEANIDNLAELDILHGTNTLIINPMQQGEISKIALFSVADYAWNNNAFNNDRSYRASIRGTVGKEYSASFESLAPYLRYFDADALAYQVRKYKESVSRGTPRPGSILGRMETIIESCDKLKSMQNSDNESYRLFYADMRPWILKLEAMAKETVALLNGEDVVAIDYSSVPDFQFEVLNGMGEDISLSTLTAEPSQEVLMNFILWLRSRKQ